MFVSKPSQELIDDSSVFVKAIREFVEKNVKDSFDLQSMNKPEAILQDAARYRWLRVRTWNEGPLAVVSDPKKSIKLGCFCPRLDILDTAIDAAMANSTEEPEDPVGMTSQEKVAMSHLEDFWNAYLALPNVGGSETTETVCDAVHVIQGILAIRVARRVNPEIWR